MSEQNNGERKPHPAPALEGEIVPQGFKVFTTSVAESAARIIRADEVLMGANAESGAEELPLTNIEIMAKVGARVAIATLLKMDGLKPDIAERLQAVGDLEGIPIQIISEEAHNTIQAIEERSLYISEERGE